MHKTSGGFGGCSGITFYTEVQGILSYTFKVEAALTEELSPEENFFPLKSVRFADNSMFWEHSKFQVSKYPLKHLYASSFNYFP